MPNLQKYVDSQTNQPLVINPVTNEITKTVNSATTWQSLTSAYTFVGTGTPFSVGGDVPTKKPTYLKPQWLYPLANGNIQVDTSAVNGFTASNLAVINANCEMGCMPMLKGDYYDNTLGRVVVTWIDSIDTPAKRTNQINFLTNFISTNNLLGIEVDFEPTAIDTKRADGITAITMNDIDNKYKFLTDLSTAVHALPPKVVNGISYIRKVSTAIAPIFALSQNSVYQMVDYQAIVNTGVDKIMVMNYDHFYGADYYDNTSQNNRSSSPFREYLEVCRWAVDNIPLEKLVMGVPDYGYAGAFGTGVTGLNFNGTTGLLRLNQAQTLLGFATAVRNTKYRTILGNVNRGGGELIFAQGTNTVHVPDSVTMNMKREICERFGIKEISMWSLSAPTGVLTPWYTGKTEPTYRQILTK
jgi:hypothetical protein